MARVTVIIPSFNHAKYLRECVESALHQTYADLDLFIIDDGSSDGSPELVESFAGPRVRTKLLGVNLGACTAVNYALLNTDSEFVAILNSDDAFLPNKIAEQVAVLDSTDYGAVFGLPQLIDEEGRPFDGHHDFKLLFSAQPMSRWERMKKFFGGWNMLCHPTILIRREVYDRVGLFDERYRQLPDLHLWFRMLQHYDILVEPVERTRFRIRDGAANTSAKSSETVSRNAFELTTIRRLFADLPQDMFEAIFEKELEVLKLGRNLPQALRLGNICVSTQHPSLKRLGLDFLFDGLPSQTVAAGQPAPTKALYKNFYNLTGLFGGRD